MGSLKILVLTYRYAPALHPRAFRWAAIVEHWARKGHRVDVVTVRTPGLPRTEESNGVRLHRVGGAVLERIKARLRGPGAPPGGPWKGTGAGETGGRAFSGLAAVAAWASDRIWKKVRWPDYAATWYFPAVGEGRRLLSAGGYDGLVTVSDPFTAHLAGLRLKREFPEIPWIVDVGDPFCFQDVTPVNNLSLYRGLNVSVEGKVFSLAEAVTVTNRPTLTQYALRFPSSAGRLRVIPPLFSPERWEAGGERVFPADGRLRLLFVGTLYRAVRSPECLLRLFDALLRTPLGDRLSLHFFGNLNDCRECFLPYRSILGTRIFLHGMADRPTVFRAMEEASCLVHIGNATPYQLPSKVVEYAGSGKPVLNLVKSADDCSAGFFEAYPAAMNLMESGGLPSGETIDRVVRFIESPRSIEPEPLARFLSSYRVEAVAAAYEGIFPAWHGEGVLRAAEEEQSP